MENAFGVLSECRQQTLPCLQKYFSSKVAENPRGFHFQGRKWIEEVLRGEFWPCSDVIFKHITLFLKCFFPEVTTSSNIGIQYIHCTKRLTIFPPSPAGMSLAKLSLDGNNKFFGDGKMTNLFLQCTRWREQF